MPRVPRLAGLVVAIAAALALVAIPEDTPARASGTAVTVDPGGTHTCALAEGGAMSCWGWNFYGQIGDGTLSSRFQPTLLDLPEVTAIALGGSHTCALTAAARAYCWGLNDSGQVGDGTLETRTTPVEVSGSGYVGITAGASHTCAITDQGGVECWGRNEAGQLGKDSPGHSSVPQSVCADDSCASLTDITALALGSAHTCAISAMDGLFCWGDNASGQLGDGGQCGMMCQRPVQVCLPDGITCQAPTAVSAGGSHTCALGGGIAYCWGDNSHGQLGDIGAEGSSVPVLVPGIDSPAAIAAGLSYSCALSISGSVRCWGQNSVGQLGSGSGLNSAVPLLVPDLADDLVDIAAGGSHTCATRASGALQCWGWNGDGRLGDGTFSIRNRPVDVIGFGSTKDTTPSPVSPTPTPTMAPGRTGDANCDDVVTAVDAALVLQFSAGLAMVLPCQSLADANGDGAVDSIDASLILQHVAGLLAEAAGARPSIGNVNHESVVRRAGTMTGRRLHG